MKFVTHWNNMNKDSEWSLQDISLHTWLWCFASHCQVFPWSCITCFQHSEILLITITAYKASEAKKLWSGSVWLLARRPLLLISSTANFPCSKFPLHTHYKFSSNKIVPLVTPNSAIENVRRGYEEAKLFLLIKWYPVMKKSLVRLYKMASDSARLIFHHVILITLTSYHPILPLEINSKSPSLKFH